MIFSYEKPHHSKYNENCFIPSILCKHYFTDPCRSPWKVCFICIIYSHRDCHRDCTVNAIQMTQTLQGLRVSKMTLINLSYNLGAVFPVGFDRDVSHDIRRTANQGSAQLCLRCSGGKDSGLHRFCVHEPRAPGEDFATLWSSPTRAQHFAQNCALPGN
jgi:hypothetical protein